MVHKDSIRLVVMTLCLVPAVAMSATGGWGDLGTWLGRYVATPTSRVEFLEVNEDRSTTTATVEPGGLVSGTGWLGGLTSSGMVRPGQGLGGFTGALHIGDTVLGEEATLDIQINGRRPGVDYDRLAIFGSLRVHGARLQVSLNYHPIVGESFTIIDNDGDEQVDGEFLGLREGAEFSVGGTRLHVSYRGASGNDVVLTVVASPNVGDAPRWAPVLPVPPGGELVPVHSDVDVGAMADRAAVLL